MQCLVYLDLMCWLIDEQMVYLKIPVGNNAHEDTQHNIIYTHGSRQCSLSRMCYSFISDQWWRRFYKWICQQASSYSITALSKIIIYYILYVDA